MLTLDRYKHSLNLLNIKKGFDKLIFTYIATSDVLTLQFASIPLFGCRRELTPSAALAIDSSNVSNAFGLRRICSPIGLYIDILTMAARLEFPKIDIRSELLGTLDEEESVTGSAISERTDEGWDTITDARIASRQSTRTRIKRPNHMRQSSKTQRTLEVSRSYSQISPPLTPRVSQDILSVRSEPETTFHNYLRAFYHFHPTSTVSSSTDESSITVPINQGDVILVHSIHPNGWADGTLLASGSRGWLPTNYCEAYDHPSIRNLLTALTHLWDLVRNGENDSLMVFTRQDYVRGMIAGVRFFLVSLSMALLCTKAGPY
jgi:hypothetical protein